MTDINPILTEFKSLYKDLLSFKSNPDFIRFGFGAGGKYRYWLDSANTLIENPESGLLKEKGIFTNSLVVLAYAYVTSQGKETQATKSINQTFKKIL